MHSGRLLLPIFYAFLLVNATTALTHPQPNGLDLKRLTTSGVVEGFVDDTTTPQTPLLKWLGVRFAQDTSGKNRWKPPQPYRSILDVVFNASEYGPACLQGRWAVQLTQHSPARLTQCTIRADGGNGTAIQSEDCLRINIIAPVNAKNLPVYIYAQYAHACPPSHPSHCVSFTVEVDSTAGHPLIPRLTEHIWLLE